jgi:hypothetical protein
MPAPGNTLSLFRQAEQGWQPCIAYDGFKFYISPRLAGLLVATRLGAFMVWRLGR